jgi:hypothetical protein
VGFESPILLFGLAGMAAPVAIHYYLRRHAPVVTMDAVVRLVLSGGRTKLRLRLVHALLLASRVLIVGLLALLFARPYLRLPAVAGMAAEHPVEFAIVLDTSMSMRLSSGGETSWARARAHVAKTLSELPPESRVHVVLATRPPESFPAAGPGVDADAATRYVSRLGPGLSGADLGAAIRLAARRVRAGEHRDRRLVVVSDFFDHAQGAALSPEDVVGIEVMAVDLSPQGPVANRAMVAATASAAPDAGPSHVRVRAVIGNDQDRPLGDVVTVRVGETRVARHVTCEARSRCAQEFLVGVEQGALAGEVRLRPDDLPDDDQRYFQLAPRNQDAVLLVDGEPGRREDRDEVFFLSRALSARVGDEAGFAVTTVRPEELSPLHLSAVGTVVLANVAHLLPEQVQAVAAFVASGRGLLVTVGGGMAQERAVSLAPGLLPAGLRDVVDFGVGGARPGRSIAWVAAGHPAVDGLLGGPGSLSTGSITRYAVLEPGWPAGTSVIASLDNGAPILVERRLGRGAVLTLLTSIDRDWNDLPLRPAFAPFVRQVMGWLRAVGGTGGRSSIDVGEPRRVEVPDGFTHAVVTPPSGEPVRLPATEDFARTRQPGVYRVELYAAGRPEPARQDVFVANPPPEESDLRRATGVPAALRATRPVGTDSSPQPVRKVALGPGLLLALLGLLLGEAYLRGKA